MMWNKTRIGEFLFAREGKYKPDSTDISGLKRVEKIDFLGNFHIVQKPSQTDMILIKNGDLVISGINVAKGAMGIYHGNEDVTATIHYSSYTFDETKIEVEYFKRFLKSIEFSRLLQEQVKGGIKTEIKPKHLLSLEIDLPNIKKQKEIVGKIKSIETEDGELKTELTYQQTLIKKLRQQILQEAIEGKLTAEWRKRFSPLPRGRTAKRGEDKYEHASVLLERIIAEKNQMIKDKKIKLHKTIPPISDEDKPFSLPLGWVWCRLGDVAILKSGNQYNYPITTDGVMFVKVGDMNTEENQLEITTSSTYFQYDKVKQNDLIPSGSIIFPKRGGAIATNKRRVVLSVPILVDSNTMAVTPSEFIDYNYFKLWFDNINLASLGNDSVVPQVNNKDIYPLIFPLPPLAEQNAIVEKVEKLLALCDQLESKITENKTHAEQLMRAVLKEAFSEK